MIPARPRSGLRRRTMVIALGASIALALGGGLGIESASAATRSRLAVSMNSDRSSAVRLDGSTANGKIYVFVRNSKELKKVAFYLDDPRRAKLHLRTDRAAPFDLAGTAADGTAVPYNTTKLPDGPHTIRAVLKWSDGHTSSRRGRFTVANKGTTPTTPSQTPRQPRRTRPLRPRRLNRPQASRLRRLSRRQPSRLRRLSQTTAKPAPTVEQTIAKPARQ